MTPEKLDQLGPAQSEELADSTDKLQKLALTLHPHPTDRPVGKPINVAIYRYTMVTELHSPPPIGYYHVRWLRHGQA